MAKPGILLMAAGKSQRFGSHKLMHPMHDGRPLILHSLDRYLSIDLPLVVVVKPEDTALHILLEKQGIDYSVNKNAHKGLGNSIAFGVKEHLHWNGWLIGLADMPYLETETIVKVAEVLSCNTIVRPCWQSQPGHPVAFGVEFADSLTQLEGDTGASRVIKEHSSQLHLLPIGNPTIVLDIDRPMDLYSTGLE